MGFDAGSPSHPSQVMDYAMYHYFGAVLGFHGSLQQKCFAGHLFFQIEDIMADRPQKAISSI